MDQRKSTDKSRPPQLQHSPPALPKIKTSATTANETPASSKSRSHHNPLHRHQQSRSHRQAKDVIQSAIQLHPPTSFGEFLKQGNRSGNHSRQNSINESRRASISDVEPEVEEKVSEINVIRPENVVREKQRGKLRDEEIRSSLQALSEKSLDTTRKLDDTYYSILERVATLKSSIAGLQEVSTLTKELQHNFKTDAEELEVDMQGQIDAFNHFEKLEERVNGVVARMQAVKDKCSSLSERLAIANERVGIREKSEAARQQKAQRQTRIIAWASTAGALLVLLLLTLYHIWIQRHGFFPITNSTLMIQNKDIDEAPIPEMAKDILRSAHESLYTRNTSSVWLQATPSASAEPRLRMLDEL